MSDRIIYLPATETRPAEPAPEVMTEEEVGRMLRLPSDANLYHALYRYRRKGVLKATQVGKAVRYRLSDVMSAIEKMQTSNPR